MIGKTFQHYKIIEELGRGGMGVVYKAEDTKLERIVAVKFLPPHIAANKDERQRFKIEAKAAASLNHPSIAHIYAIEESDGETFIVMEYIEGEELKDIVGARRAVPLPVDEIINYAIQIAEGLKTAHSKGIVHRDIKSANIMLTDQGQIKIMDFGLAKVRGGVQVTKVGTTLGTAAYMSPEQTRGEDVDHRSDIWSLGVVLFEMLSGKLPFAGEYEQAVAYSIINESPDLSPIPAEMQPILEKALAKDRVKRYQQINELLVDLRNLTGGTSVQTTSSRIAAPVGKAKSVFKRNLIVAAAGAALILIILSYLIFFNRAETESPALQRKMLVVLPFENLGSSEDEYFADGITSEITSKLSGLSELGVIARSSAMQYKNSQKSLSQIGEELGVQYVLEGTVQWENLANGGRRVRVNPELIQLENDTQIWSKPYEADFSSAFKLQADIAATVADALNLTLISSEKHNLEEKITDNSDAYDLYLRALNYSYDIANEKNSRIAEQMFLKAIDLDKNFAAAYAGLSTVQSNMYWVYYERTEENLDNARSNAQTALAINPDLPAGHVALGDYFYHGRLDYESALAEYNEALQVQPNNVNANNGIGWVLRRQGKMQKAIASLEKNLEFDPKNYNTLFSVGETYILLRQYDKAIPFLNRAISIAADARTPYVDKSVCAILGEGDIKKARNIILETLERKIGLDYNVFKYQLYLYDIFEGNFKSALNQVEGVKELDEQFYYKPEDLLVAYVYSLLGNKALAEKHFDAAIRVLQQKIKENPDDSRLYTSLGLAYAGLGKKSEAIREGKKGYDLLPISREAWRGTHRLLDLAQIYTMTGEKDLAIKAIGELINRPTDALSVSLLKIDPVWDPLRDDPDFQKLINN
jgi:serine/threonine protein kinase/Flp pilus assembly protein TadD